MKIHRQPTTVRFRQADPAGIMFFANVFELAHDAYEGFIESLGVEWSQWFDNPEWAVPIRHTQASYLRPMRPSETYDISVVVEALGESSFTLRYVFTKDDDTYCEVATTHIFLNKKTASKMPIPATIRSLLEAYQRQGVSAN